MSIKGTAQLWNKKIKYTVNKQNLKKQMENVADLIERKDVLQNNEKINSKKNIPPVLTYNRTLPNISDLVRKNCHIRSWIP